MAEALLVDDDPNQLRGLGELVEREGFTTRRAATIAEARALLLERVPDVVITDLVLPDGSGLDLLKTLEEESSKTQMVLVTGKIGRAHV